jgi:DNA-binding GntR family transcriptional regulator
MDSGSSLRRGNMRRRVYEEIKELIRNGIIVDQLLSEAPISRRLGVSRTPVREALLQLKAEGWLEDGYDGLRVRMLDDAEIQETYALREALEGAAARLAALRATSAELQALQEVAKAFTSAAESGQAPAVLDGVNDRFHVLLHRSSHSDLLQRILEPLHSAKVRLQPSTFSQAGRATVSATEHEAIVAALVARDEHLAEDLARRHVRAGAVARSRLIAKELSSG